METTFLVIFTLLFLFFQTYGASSSSNTIITASSNVTCIQTERQSLLKFRQGLAEESNRLSTWTGVECCQWEGVGCDRRNGHVVKLDLRSPLSFTDDYALNTSNWLEGKVSLLLILGKIASLEAFQHTYASCIVKLLDLSDNNFSGVLPKCLGNLIQLQVMDLTNNTITGDVPNSLGFLSYLQSLHLHNNKFEGNLPMALQNLTSLVTFDLGNNFLTGNIPSWIGKKLSKLKILNLQSNKFMGNIPPELCKNNALQHLNLANNSITGMIPRCFYNLTGMIMTSVNFDDNDTGYEENIEAYIKGIKLKYTHTSRFLTSLDLSSNNIIGEIPDVLMKLVALNNLNLSRNLLSGQISERIGNLKQMESLDFSMNSL